MNTIPTAKELFDKMISENDEATSTEMMIEFAKLHVQQALKQAVIEANVEEYGILGEDKTFYRVEEDSILNAYPLTNIK